MWIENWLNDQSQRDVTGGLQCGSDIYYHHRPPHHPHFRLSRCSTRGPPRQVAARWLTGELRERTSPCGGARGVCCRGGSRQARRGTLRLPTPADAAPREEPAPKEAAARPGGPGPCCRGDAAAAPAGRARRRRLFLRQVLPEGAELSRAGPRRAEQSSSAPRAAPVSGPGGNPPPPPPRTETYNPDTLVPCSGSSKLMESLKKIAWILK
ncbi:uncharacterized protein LOC133274709 [Pezoporus flaviventris]|uniref:uncharacterized protein LOC133274709 n=1 Tax=Pezoporus flaviventris TaxID=889875 RepID=UPI002AAF4C1F|nr:uncharacterized protein LOC133274709 [Pezoporus flaviventris]